MTKLQALEVIDGYEQDFDEILSILDNDSLTPSQKCDSISEIVKEPDEEEEEEEGD